VRKVVGNPGHSRSNGRRDAEPDPSFSRGRLGGYEEAAMFTNIMTGPIVIDVAGVSALGQGLAYCEDEEARVQRLALIVPGNAEARAYDVRS
jgi:hypothetical protein